jgi:hypothetical protein
MTRRYGLSAYRRVWTSCSIVGDSSLSVEDHQIDRLVRPLHDPSVGPQREDLNILAVGIANLPGGAVVDLRPVADGDDGVGLPESSKVGVKRTRRTIRRLRFAGYLVAVGKPDGPQTRARAPILN